MAGINKDSGKSSYLIHRKQKGGLVFYRTIRKKAKRTEAVFVFSIDLSPDREIEIGLS